MRALNGFPSTPVRAEDGWTAIWQRRPGAAITAGANLSISNDGDWLADVLLVLDDDHRSARAARLDAIGRLPTRRGVRGPHDNRAELGTHVEAHGSPALSQLKVAA